METLVLERFFYGRAVTLGLLVVGRELLYTAEDPWVGNAPMISCIPDDLYDVEPRRFNRGGYDAWEILNVPGRSQIKIHRGNTADDVSGCIVVGRELACFGGSVGVANSAAAWKILYGALGGRAFRLSITPTVPLAGTRTGGD